MTKLGTPNLVYKAPYASPTTTPMTRAATIARASGQLLLTMPTAMIAAARPLTEPTERSISPRSSTSTMPMAIVPTAALWRVRLTRLRLERNESFMIWKAPQMTTSPMTTGNDPRSPLFRRDTKAANHPRTPWEAMRRSSCRSDGSGAAVVSAGTSVFAFGRLMTAPPCAPGERPARRRHSSWRR
jgi:hypothetical protein